MKIVQIQDKHIINKKNLPKWQQKLYDGNGNFLSVAAEDHTGDGTYYCYQCSIPKRLARQAILA